MARKQKRERDNQEEATMWQQRHTNATSEQEKLFDKFRDFFDIMYATRSYKNIAPWRSKIYIPILAGKAWDFIARLADVEPRFIATIREEWELDENGQPYFPEEVSARAEKISQNLSWDYKNPLQQESPRNRVFDTLVDAVVTGSAFVEVSRSVEEKQYRAHEAIDEMGNVNMEEEIIQTVTEGENTFEPDSVFNWKFAPNSNSVQSAPWIIHDGFETLDELKQNPLYDSAVLAKIDSDFHADSDPNAQYSVSRNRLLTSDDRIAADSSVKFLKTHKTFHRNEEGKVVIQKWVEGGTDSANDTGWLKIFESVDPFWHNKYPVQGFYIRRKPYSVWGESLFENNESLQYASNDVFNHYMDNLNLSLDGMVMMDENAYVEDFVVAPGELLIYKNEQPKQFKFNEPNPGQLSQVMNTMNQAIEAATVSQYATGVPSSQLDNTAGTATGISKIMDAAEDKLGFMRANFKSAMEGVGQMWVVNDQQFMDRQKTVPMETPDGLVPMVITPLDMQGIISVTIDDDSMTPVSKSERRNQDKEYFDQVQSLSNASIAQVQTASQIGDNPDVVYLNYNAIMRDVSSSYGKRVYSQYVLRQVTSAPLPPMEGEPVAEEAPEQNTDPMLADDVAQAQMQGGVQ